MIVQMVNMWLLGKNTSFLHYVSLHNNNNDLSERWQSQMNVLLGQSWIIYFAWTFSDGCLNILYRTCDTLVLQFKTKSFFFANRPVESEESAKWLENSLVDS